MGVGADGVAREALSEKVPFPQSPEDGRESAKQRARGTRFKVEGRARVKGLSWEVLVCPRTTEDTSMATKY